MAPSEVLAQYQELCERLRALPIPLTPEGDPGEIGLTSEAQGRWHELARRHAQETNDPVLPKYLVGPYRKLETYAARFALILHLARYVSEPDDIGILIDEQSVEYAWALVDYFKGHARKVFGQLRREPRNDRAAILHDWIVEQGGRVTAREVYTAQIAAAKPRVMRWNSSRSYGPWGWGN